MATQYTADFYQVQQGGSLSSAEIVVPMVLSKFKVASVVDVGCGVGTWLKAFHDLGITDLLGVDGDYVPLDLFKIDRSRFKAADLRQGMDFGRRFDLACSLEVAEHLPPESAEAFVDTLVKAAPVILFSAAVPNQGGTAHLNEQWQTYWADLFAKRGYVTLDFIRPAVYSDKRIEWWYRQNALIFCIPSLCPEGVTPVTDPYDVNLVMPEMIDNIIVPSGGRESINRMKVILPVLGRSILQRLGMGG